MYGNDEYIYEVVIEPSKTILGRMATILATVVKYGSSILITNQPQEELPCKSQENICRML